MKLFKVLFALMFLATGIAIEARKVLADSPEGICVNKGYERGTEEFNQCVREQQQQAAEEQQDAAFERQNLDQEQYSPYGPSTGIVPSWQQNGSQSE